MMKTLLAGLMNWQTTGLGILGGLTNALTSAPKLASGTPSEKAHVILTSLGMMLVGLLSKDADKTGVLGKKNE